MEPKDKRLLDKHGNPVGNPTPTEVEKIAEQFKVELNTAIDRLRELNQHDMRSVGETVFGPQIKFWKKVTFWTAVIATIILVGGSIWGILKVPDIIETKTQKYIADNLVGPALTNTVNNVISNRASIFVIGRLAPLSNSVDAMEKRVVSESERLEKAQVLLSARLEVQDLLVKAKGGSRDAYDQLKRLGTNSVVGESANAAALEIEFFFRNWANEATDYAVNDGVSGAKFSPTLDEAVATMLDPTSAADNRMIAAYHLRKFGHKNVIESLVEALNSETNLYAATQMLRSISTLSGNEIWGLDFGRVSAWWLKAQNDTNYHSVYQGICRFGSTTTFNNHTPAREIVDWMNGIEREPLAIKSRCIRGFYLNRLNETNKADADFRFVETQAPEHAYLHFYRGGAMLERNEVEKGIHDWNKAFEERPSLGLSVAKLITERLATNALFRWPTNLPPLKTTPK